MNIENTYMPSIEVYVIKISTELLDTPDIGWYVNVKITDNEFKYYLLRNQ